MVSPLFELSTPSDKKSENMLKIGFYKLLEGIMLSKIARGEN